MRPYYLLLMVLWGALAFYTAQVIPAHGANFFRFYFGDLSRWGWPGQFDLDFGIMLFLAASWIAWRARFAPSALALAAISIVGGALILLPFLTYLAWKHQGDTAAILLGNHHKAPTA